MPADELLNEHAAWALLVFDALKVEARFLRWFGTERYTPAITVLETGLLELAARQLVDSMSALRLVCSILC